MLSYALTFSLCIAAPSLAGDAPCSRLLSVPLRNPDRLANGALLHDNLTYPSGLYWTSGDQIYGCACNVTVACVRRCCERGKFLNGSRCSDASHNETDLLRPADAELAEELRWIERIEDAFYTIDSMDCPGEAKYRLEPDVYPLEDSIVLLANGTLNMSAGNVLQSQYCLAQSVRTQEFTVLLCFPEGSVSEQPIAMTIYPIGLVISISSLLATFLVYAVIPELRNLPGRTLMSYVICLLTAYTFLAVIQTDHNASVSDTACVAFAFIIHFSFLASFFWLNVMCFDIWWTFGGFRSLQGSVKQRERKKFIMYSIYAWGCASILTGVCMIMDLVPDIPKDFVRPGFGIQSCWFNTDTAKAIYFYGPMGVTVVCNICLFISTALKIIRHKKDTAHQLRGADSKRHDDNKQWFNLYLKLFIVMGINWSMEIISWLCEKDTPKYIWYITDLGNTLQGLIIFIIFVWKDKIKRLLAKRFGCQGRNFLSRESMRSGYHSSSSRTCTTSAPLHEKPDPYVDGNFRARSALDESDGA